MAGPTRPNADAASSGGAFHGFEAADFAAYEAKKWTSNAFTLPRRKVKDKLLSLARAVVAEVGEELADLDLHGSDEAPTVANGKKVQAQYAFFTRDAESRAAIKGLINKTDLQGGANLFDIGLQHQHACLYLRVDLAGFSVGIEIAGKARADRDNVVEKLRQSWARDKLVELAKALPGGSTIGLEGATADALELSQGGIEAWIPKLQGSEGAFGSQTLIARDEPALGTEAFIGAVVQQVEAHLPIYRFLAWSRENAHTQVKETIKKAAVEQKKKAQPAFQPGDRVTILAGLFAGRSGYLSEVDGKGRAKVMVGPVSVNVEAKDLKAN